MLSFSTFHNWRGFYKHKSPCLNDFQRTFCMFQTAKANPYAGPTRRPSPTVVGTGPGPRSI
jgi:hypothetical protein